MIGASSGIGRALAKILVREGYRVGATARRESLLRELEAECDGAVLVSAFDIADVERSIAAIEHLVEELGGGHLVNLSSIAALRGIAGAPAYNASKAYASNYMQGLRQQSVADRLGITVTDIQLGLVRTAMAKVDRIPSWVVGPEVAAEHIWRAIRRRRAHAYVTPVWRLLAWAMRLAPGFLWNRIRG